MLPAEELPACHIFFFLCKSLQKINDGKALVGATPAYSRTIPAGSQSALSKDIVIPLHFLVLLLTAEI